MVILNDHRVEYIWYVTNCACEDGNDTHYNSRRWSVAGAAAYYDYTVCIKNIHLFIYFRSFLMCARINRKHRAHFIHRAHRHFNLQPRQLNDTLTSIIKWNGYLKWMWQYQFLHLSLFGCCSKGLSFYVSLRIVWIHTRSPHWSISIHRNLTIIHRAVSFIYHAAAQWLDERKIENEFTSEMEFHICIDLTYLVKKRSASGRANGILGQKEFTYEKRNLCNAIIWFLPWI